MLEAGWAQGLVWMGAEKLTHTRIQSVDHPVTILTVLSRLKVKINITPQHNRLRLAYLSMYSLSMLTSSDEWDHKVAEINNTLRYY
jgi:hemolysin activation/secretion protein